MIRFGIIGCGNISGTHAEAIALIDEAVLVACCDNNQGKRFEHDCFLQRLSCWLVNDAVIIAWKHYKAFQANSCDVRTHGIIGRSLVVLAAQPRICQC